MKNKVLETVTRMKVKDITNEEYHKLEQKLTDDVTDYCSAEVSDYIYHHKDLPREELEKNLIKVAEDFLISVNDILLSYGLYFEMNASEKIERLYIELKHLTPEKPSLLLEV